jgi:glycosyltransferase involved in cell wall biosynthesis
MERAIRRRRRGAGTSIRIINNFSRDLHEDGDVALPEELARTEGVFRILFAGNVGRFQGLETAVDAMRRLDTTRPVELVFMGEGAAKEDLMARSRDLLQERIRFVPHYPEAIALQAIRGADVCLVMLRKDIYQFAYPSKTMTYLAQGRPLIVSVERESELAELVGRRGVGEVVSCGDAQGLADAIRALVDDPERLTGMADRAARVAEEEFGTAMILGRWSELMKELAAERSPRH